jgi:VanZ family protein
MPKVKKAFAFWLPVVFWMGLIFWLSDFHKLQASPIGWQDFILRKLAHFWEYVFLYLLVFRAIKNTTKLKFSRLIVLSLLLTIFYSLTDEYHQTFVTGRTGRLFDITVDSLGGVFGAGFVTRILPKFPKKFRKYFQKAGLLTP